jgi:hypothetical protein
VERLDYTQQGKQVQPLHSEQISFSDENCL